MRLFFHEFSGFEHASSVIPFSHDGRSARVHRFSVFALALIHLHPKLSPSNLGRMVSEADKSAATSGKLFAR